MYVFAWGHARRCMSVYVCSRPCARVSSPSNQTQFPPNSSSYSSNSYSTFTRSRASRPITVAGRRKNPCRQSKTEWRHSPSWRQWWTGGRIIFLFCYLLFVFHFRKCLFSIYNCLKLYFTSFFPLRRHRCLLSHEESTSMKYDSPISELAVSESIELLRWLQRSISLVWRHQLSTIN